MDDLTKRHVLGKEYKAQCESLKAHRCGNERHVVVHRKAGGVTTRSTVDLRTKSCTCMQFILYRLPCLHVVYILDKHKHRDTSQRAEFWNSMWRYAIVVWDDRHHLMGWYRFRCFRIVVWDDIVSSNHIIVLWDDITPTDRTMLYHLMRRYKQFLWDVFKFISRDEILSAYTIIYATSRTVISFHPIQCYFLIRRFVIISRDVN